MGQFKRIHDLDQVTSLSDNDFLVADVFTTGGGFLLLETGDNLLLENGDNLSLEGSSGSGFQTRKISYGDISVSSSGSEPYSELTYTSGDLTLIEVYESSSKTTLLKTKDYTYTSGLLTQIVETNVSTSATKTTNLTYDVSGVLINIEKI